MRELTIIYHYEPEGWWADSPDLDGFDGEEYQVDERCGGLHLVSWRG